MAPARSRPSTNVATERPNRGPTPLPAYQPPQHPLNEAAQRALQNLPRNHKLDALKTRQRAANNHLTQAAADVNDRLQEKTAEFERRRRNLEKQGSQQSNEATRPILDEMRQNTDEMTAKLEGSVRKIIDASAEVEGMERALKELQENVSNNRGHLGATQSTIGASQARQNHRRRGAGSDDEGSEFEDEVTQTVGENDSAIAALKQKIAEQRSAYQAMSMSHRYVAKRTKSFDCCSHVSTATPPTTTTLASRRSSMTHTTQKTKRHLCLTRQHGLPQNRQTHLILRLGLQLRRAMPLRTMTISPSPLNASALSALSLYSR